MLEEEAALDALLAGRIDFATIVQSPLSRSAARPGVDYLPITDDEMRVAVAADHPLATRTSVSLEELCDEPWMVAETTGTCADSNVVLHAFRGAGYDPNLRFQSDDYQALLGMAASGIGVAMIPTLALVSLALGRGRAPLRGRAPARQILAAVRSDEDNALVEHMVESLRCAGRTARRAAVAGRRPGAGAAIFCCSSAAISPRDGRRRRAAARPGGRSARRAARCVRLVLAQALGDHVGAVVGAAATEQATG